MINMSSFTYNNNNNNKHNYDNDIDPDSTSSDGGSTIRQLRRPSTATILSRAISDFESDFNAWDSSYKLRRLPAPNTVIQPRPYIPTPYSTVPIYPPSAISRITTTSVGSIRSIGNNSTIGLGQKSCEEEEGKQRVGRLGGVGIYNPHFEPGTTFPRRMSRVAVLGDIDTDIDSGSGTLVEASGDSGVASGSDIAEREEGAEEVGYLGRLKKEILRKARERKARKEG
ncbi:hypothetical protein TWF506_011376 [Arthrobotrys conoides]|uniref:Uncharacterized protein n=1 Tax=Arthrobotrys conoides TaxID=74498 RepID=A0AAN8N650_9PEZI